MLLHCSIASKTVVRVFRSAGRKCDLRETSGTIPSGVFCLLHELQLLMFPPQTFAHTVTAVETPLGGGTVSNRETSEFRTQLQRKVPTGAFW